MTGATRLATRIYDLLLRLYPRYFREEFGDEMRTVFAMRLADRTGARERLGKLLLHESAGLLRGVIGEHLQAASRNGAHMKHKTAAILGLTLASILVLARRPVASYFCNLADPAGGGLGNHVACGIYYGQSDGTLLTIAGYVLLAMALALVFRGKMHARNRF